MDVTRFGRCAAAPNCSAVIDPAPRGWAVALVPPEETAAQTQTAFCDALEAEDLIGAVEGSPGVGELPDSDETPILSAVSDNGAPTTADAAKAFMALCSTAQHPDRPNTPIDQAPQPRVQRTSDAPAPGMAGSSRVCCGRGWCRCR